VRIIFLGDSLTWGGYGGDFVKHVAEKLPDHVIINAGIGGDTAINILRRLEDEINKHQPDAAFVMVGGNDAVSYSMPRTRSYYKNAKNIEDGKVTLEQYAQAYRGILTGLLSHRIMTGIGLAPTEYNAELIEVRKRYMRQAHSIAESLKVPVLDFCQHFTVGKPVERDPVDMAFILNIGKRSASGWDDYESERQRWNYTFTFDGMHLTPETAQKFADLLVDFIKREWM